MTNTNYFLSFLTDEQAKDRGFQDIERPEWYLENSH